MDEVQPLNSELGFESSSEFVSIGFEKIDEAFRLLCAGYTEKKIIGEYGIPFAAVQIARAWIINRKQKKVPFRIFMLPEDLRFATNWNVAVYRAERIFESVAMVEGITKFGDVAKDKGSNEKKTIILDIGCGIGIQGFAFAKKFFKVIAIDNDERKIKFAKANAKLLGIKNINFYCSDVLNFNPSDVVDNFRCIAFCDTERAASSERRILDEIKPNIFKLIERFKNIAIELPPYISVEHLKNVACEREYISYNGKLNRLTIYCGDLMRCMRSAVSLPTKARLDDNNSNDRSTIRIRQLAKPLKYIYEIDKSIIMAGLIGELFRNIKSGDVFVCGGYATSNKILDNDFFVSSYENIGCCKNDGGEVLKQLKILHAGKVILRYKIPDFMYWKERRFYEERLNGDKVVYIFKFGDAVFFGKRL